jgi:hypothetical protein
MTNAKRRIQRASETPRKGEVGLRFGLMVPVANVVKGSQTANRLPRALCGGAGPSLRSDAHPGSV